MNLAGVTQGRLAVALGVSQPFVSQVLAGKRPWPAGMEGAGRSVRRGRRGGR